MSISGGTILLLLAGAGATAWQAGLLLLARASSDWHRTTGRVLNAYVGEGRIWDADGDAEDTHSANVRYTYRVGRETFESSRLAYRSARGLSLSAAGELLRGISKGKDVDVYYDPKRPSRSVLIPGSSRDNVVHTSLAVLLLVFGLWEAIG